MRADLVGLEVDPVAEEQDDAGLVERAGERGGLGARPGRAGVLARAQQVGVGDHLTVPEPPLERLHVGQPHQPPRLRRRHLLLPRVPPRRVRQRRVPAALQRARRRDPAAGRGAGAAPGRRGGGRGGAEEGAGDAPH